jgi:broad-specificity NMP kinase
MTCLNSVLSTEEVSSISWRATVVDKGVDTSLAPSIFVLLRMYVFVLRQEKSSRGWNDFHAEEKMKGSHVFDQ